MAKPRQWRPQPELPEDLVDDLHIYAERNGNTVGELCFHWIVQAGRLVYQGHGYLLPPRTRARAGEERERGRRVRWPQSRDRHEQYVLLIESTGSSIPAVLRVAIQAYLDARGDELAMAWPPVPPPATARRPKRSSGMPQQDSTET